MRISRFAPYYAILACGLGFLTAPAPALGADDAKNAGLTTDPDLRKFVAKTLPTLKNHLQHIQRLKNGLRT